MVKKRGHELFIIIQEEEGLSDAEHASLIVEVGKTFEVLFQKGVLGGRDDDATSELVGKVSGRDHQQTVPSGHLDTRRQNGNGHSQSDHVGLVLGALDRLLVLLLLLN